ncbi:MAG: hypothetical protein BroJett006_27420 [Betaproteobacteria bacterium]|nr:MAG: hypothetical protein BroJett006_27420 [Betaproteobacteria bacterium]
MGIIRTIASFLNPIRPFKGAATSTLKPARDGLEIIKDLADRLPKSPSESQPLPENYDPYEHFRDKCRKYGLDKARLAEMEKTLLRKKRVMQLALVFTLAVVAGFLIAAEDGMRVFKGVMLLPFAGYSFAKVLQLSVRLRQVRARALYTWPQFCALFQSRSALIAYLLDPEF